MNNAVKKIEKFMGSFKTPKDRLDEYINKYNLYKYYTNFIFIKDRYDISRKKYIKKQYCTKCHSFYEVDGPCLKCSVCGNDNIQNNIFLKNNEFEKHIIDILFLIEVIDENKFNIVRIDKTIDLSTFEKDKIVEDIFIRGYIEYNYEEDIIYAYILKKDGNYRKTKKITDLLRPKGKRFTKTTVIGTEQLKKCSNFYLKTGHKEIEELFDISDGCCWSYKNIERLIKYIDYNKNNKNNQVELLVKAGFNQLVKRNYLHGQYETSEILNRKGSKIKDLIKLPKNVIKLVKNFDEDIILKLEEIHKKGNGISVEFVKFLIDESFNGIMYENVLNNISKIIDFGFTNKEIHNYLLKADLYQAIHFSETLQLWYDYLYMAKILDVPYKKFPNSLKKEHDLMARNFKYKEEEIIEKQFKARSKKLMNLEYQNDEYLILVPKETKEVIREGNILRHCVASYIKRIANGETIVLFIRKKEAPEEPFYTVEVRDGAVTQVRGFANKNADDKIIEFINEWEKEKLSDKKTL